MSREDFVKRLEALIQEAQDALLYDEHIVEELEIAIDALNDGDD